MYVTAILSRMLAFRLLGCQAYLGGGNKCWSLENREPVCISVAKVNASCTHLCGGRRRGGPCDKHGNSSEEPRLEALGWGFHGTQCASPCSPQKGGWKPAGMESRGLKKARQSQQCPLCALGEGTVTSKLPQSSRRGKKLFPELLLHALGDWARGGRDEQVVHCN